jgi:hypothetical protein
MGGAVTVVIRRSDGTEYRMQRWTNSMIWGICNNLMMQEDDNHIEEYICSWKDMKLDWETNKDSGQFKNPMNA